ncbi:hypothetical protein CBW65_12440 [Tumebacillus avium]|uniref:STAS domain-containing protein n=2 Tax=Tumebacillus avium TaxID=1903704 RepID=A0A1Y0IQV0_9BACL|nr:hypothetical protein CBW65_12440 [Tumebacillus avium]
MEMRSIETLRIIIADQQGILEEWMNLLTEQGSEMQDRFGREYLTQQSERFLGSLIKLLEEQSDNYRVDEREGFNRLLQELSLLGTQAGSSPKSFMPYALTLKEVIFHRLQTLEATELSVVYAVISQLDRMFSKMSHYYYEEYINRREQVIKAQALAIQELSAPVIQVWEGILALPLIGTIDTQRAKGIMENLLEEIVRTKCPHVIIDITGVPIVDTGVAERLIKTVEAGRLVGAECILTGIRPEVAQTLVMLGVSLGDIVTKATLQAGLAHILKTREQGRLQVEESVI